MDGPNSVSRFRFLFSRYSGEMIQFELIFSNGLVQPQTSFVWWNLEEITKESGNDYDSWVFVRNGLLHRGFFLALTLKEYTANQAGPNGSNKGRRKSSQQNKWLRKMSGHVASALDFLALNISHHTFLVESHCPTSLWYFKKPTPTAGPLGLHGWSTVGGAQRGGGDILTWCNSFGCQRLAMHQINSCFWFP